jgi:hypothetical protein
VIVSMKIIGTQRILAMANTGNATNSGQEAFLGASRR